MHTGRDCPLCQLTFRDSKLCKEHLATSHNCERVYCIICPTDGNTFRGPSELRRHIRKIHDKSDMTYSDGPEFSKLCCMLYAVEPDRYSLTSEVPKKTEAGVEQACARALQFSIKHGISKMRGLVENILAAPQTESDKEPAPKKQKIDLESFTGSTICSVVVQKDISIWIRLSDGRPLLVILNRNECLSNLSAWLTESNDTEVMAPLETELKSIPIVAFAKQSKSLALRLKIEQKHIINIKTYQRIHKPNPVSPEVAVDNCQFVSPVKELVSSAEVPSPNPVSQEVADDSSQLVVSSAEVSSLEPVSPEVTDDCRLVSSAAPSMPAAEVIKAALSMPTVEELVTEEASDRSTPLSVQSSVQSVSVVRVLEEMDSTTVLSPVASPEQSFTPPYYSPAHTGKSSSSLESDFEKEERQVSMTEREKNLFPSQSPLPTPPPIPVDSEELMAQGAWPLLPPARRDWEGGAINISLPAKTYTWPPTNWKTLTPDQRRDAWLAMSVMLNWSASYGTDYPDRSAKSITEEYNMLHLPGSSDVPSDSHIKPQDKYLSDVRLSIHSYLKHSVNESGDTRSSVMDMLASDKSTPSPQQIKILDSCKKENIPVQPYIRTQQFESAQAYDPAIHHTSNDPGYDPRKPAM